MTDTATRRAALALHGLTREDREWAIARLTPGDRENVTVFLDELEELGFPRDASELAHEVQADDQPAEIDPEVEVIDTAAPRIVHRILGNEQLAILALVMDHHPWRWRNRVMRWLGRARSRAIDRAIEQKKYAVADPVRRTVIESLAEAVATVSKGKSRLNGAGRFGWGR